MGTDRSSQFPPFLSIDLPRTEPIVLDPPIGRKLCNHIASIRLRPHTYSLIHNLIPGSPKPTNALESAYRRELPGLDIHLDDGGEHSLTHGTPKQLSHYYACARQLNLTVHLETRSTQEPDADRISLNQRRWASNQVDRIKSLLAELRWLATPP